MELFARYPQPDWAVWGLEADADVTPQGKIYRGYGGGPFETPPSQK